MIFDLHNDLPTSDLSAGRQTEYICGAEGNVITLAVWTSRLVSPIDKVKRTVNSFSDYPSVKFAVEDAWFISEDNMEEFTSFPLLYCTLAWSGNNALAGGHTGDGGVTDLGRKFIKSLNSAGIAVDVAHLNERSFYDVLDSGAKVLCSHTCLRDICDHTRNLNDNQIRALIDAGGMTGIAAVADFMGGRGAGINGYALQLCRYAEKFGVGTLGIGTDFFGTEPFEGLENYSCFDNLAAVLLNKGFTGREINDIFFNNANKFFSDIGEK